MTTTLPLGPTPPGGLGIDPRLGAAALRAPAASREDSSHPQIPASIRGSATSPSEYSLVMVDELSRLILACISLAIV